MKERVLWEKTYPGAAACPGPGLRCPPRRRVEGGTRRSPSDLLLPPGAEESDHGECDSPGSRSPSLGDTTALELPSRAAVWWRTRRAEYEPLSVSSRTVWLV